MKLLQLDPLFPPPDDLEIVFPEAPAAPAASSTYDDAPNAIVPPLSEGDTQISWEALLPWWPTIWNNGDATIDGECRDILSA